MAQPGDTPSDQDSMAQPGNAPSNGLRRSEIAGFKSSDFPFSKQEDTDILIPSKTTCGGNNCPSFLYIITDYMIRR